MKVLKGIIIIIYIILGASFGIMLIPEILNDLGMNNHPIYTNHYVDGLIGMIVFFLIFGLFINKVTRLLKEAEIWIMQRSAVEILFATLGLVVGLFISVMVSFILEMIFYIKSPCAYYYYIIIMLFRIPVWFEKA